MPNLIYKNKPLVRSGNTLYYGDVSDKYVVCMQIESAKKVGGLDVADKVIIQLISTDPDVSRRKRIVKSAKKDGLFAAVDIAEAWLRRYCKNSNTTKNNS